MPEDAQKGQLNGRNRNDVILEIICEKSWVHFLAEPSMHFWCRNHRCTFGVGTIDALLVSEPSMHFWCRNHRCTFGVGTIDALSVSEPSMHFWRQYHRCTFGPLEAGFNFTLSFEN